MDAQHAVVLAADLLVGAVLVVGGVLLARRERVAGALLVVTGGAWFAGFLWSGALFWHRGPLAHLLLAYAGLRPHTIPALVVAAATYVVSVVTPTVWLDDRATVGLGVGLVAAAGWNLRGTAGLGKHRRRLALTAALAVGGGLALAGTVRLVVGAAGWPVSFAAYDAGLVAATLLLVVGSAPARVARLRDLGIDLGEGGEQPSRDALARTLRDPDLVVAVWDPARDAYVTPDGAPVPERTPGRGATRVDRDGRPFVLLVHDPALGDDRRLREALSTAARVAGLNTTWRGEVAHQAARLADSRRRLLAAADDERRRLERELSTGVGARLDELAATLHELRTEPGDHLSQATMHLARTRQDLDELAAGLRPRALERGLEAAVRELAAAAPLRVEVRCETGPVPGEVELAAYYVCAEALSNAAKHAPDARVSLDVVARDGLLAVTVSDDGSGGAGFVERGGLLGLRDRVEALDGRLTVVSDGTGTRVAAELPLGRHPS